MEREEQTKQLVILHFNDAYDIQIDQYGELGFINFYDHVQRLRQIYPQSLLIFSGDAFAPSKLSRALKGQQMLHCLQMLNIDVACYGNHDFDFQPQHSLKLAKSCDFPWLMGNIKYIDTGENIGEGLDYYILDKNGTKIGFLGLAGPDFNGRLISYYHKKLKYIDIAEYAKKICKKLLSLGCELIIALTHARKPADTDLAKKVPQIDIILGGHDHFSLFQVINQIPIVKSASNFQCISIIKIFKENLTPQKSKDIRLGRRWLFSSQCKKVKKSIKQYPQIQNFIKNAVKQYQKYERSKNISQNKPKKDIPKLPQNRWNLDYGFINSKVAIGLSAGLSAEVCFAKYVAFKRKCIYSGYKNNLPQIKENFIQQTLAFIQEQINNHKNNGKIVLYSPGINSVPYLVQTANMIYLPSHFVAGVNCYEDLVKMLDYSFKKGYKCYAILQNNPSFENKVCVWIKFIEPPMQYINLIKKLKAEDIIIMSRSNIEQKRNIKLISGYLKEEKKIAPQPRDIYASFAMLNNQKMLKENISYYTKLIKDKQQHFWLQASQRFICPFIGDLQNSIDCIETIQPLFKRHLPQQKVNYTYILNDKIWNLNLIAYHMGKQFISHNYLEQQGHLIKGRGIVMNQYLMSNPTYELNYGYIPILYSHQWKNNQQRILQALTEEQRNLKRWLNVYRNTRLNIIKHDSTKITTDSLGLELAKWVAKHSPKEYALKYLSIEQIFNCLQNHNFLFKVDEKGSLNPF